jgi:LysR family glycine cleavage system transcriptional activator
LSFTLAASELRVTPGAVSRQIRILEDFVGSPLFVRANREVSLTPTGARYLQQVTESFAQLMAATQQIMATPEKMPIRVASSITFTLWWLTPRLLGYHSQNPDRDFQLTTSLAPVDFRRDGLDAVIRLDGNTPHAFAHKLFSADLMAVCSPKLLADGKRLKTLDDLRHHTLLHSMVRPGNWERLLAAAGHPTIRGAHQMKFESSSLAYQAALDGVGIAVAHLPLIVDELKSGRLVAPFNIRAHDSGDYYFVWPDNAARNKGLMRFKDWIIKEAAKTVTDVEAFVAGWAARS